MLGAQTSLWSNLYARGTWNGGVVPSTLLNDLESAWPLSEDGTDAVGSNDLTNNNGVTFVPLGPTGVVGDFIGTSLEYLSRADASATDLRFGDSFSFSAWFKPTAHVAGQVLIGKDDALSRGYVVYYNTTEKINLQLPNADGTNLNTGVVSSNSAVDGQWNFVVATYNHLTGDATITLNGVTTTTAQAEATFTSLAEFDLGRESFAGFPFHLTGTLARVGAYNAVVDDAVKTSLFNSGKGKSYADLTTAEKVGLVSYWNLDEISGNRADSHGSNTLTDNNTVGSFITGPSGVVAFPAGDDLESLSSASNPFAAASAATVNFWLKYEAHHGNGSAFTLDNAGPDRLFYHATANTFWYVFDTTGAFEVISYDVVTNPGWHMITLTVDGAERKLRLYADGVLQATSAALANPVNFASAGFIDLSQSGQFSGKYANFGTWSTVIDGATITALFNGGKGKRYADLTTADKVGLLQYANFDEVSGNRLDSHGANDFTDNNAVGYTFNSYPANMPGTVANFVAASSQYFNRSGDVWPHPANSGSTVAAWVKTTNTGNTGIVSQYNGVGVTGVLVFEFGGNLSVFSAQGFGALPNFGAINDGNWHLCVFTWDNATGDAFGYVDGGAGVQHPGSPPSSNWGSPPWGATDFEIGAHTSGTSNFNGNISSPLIWSRVLTPTERATLWNGGDGGFYPFTGLP